MKKPKLAILDSDGNAFAILAKAKKAALKAGWNRHQIRAFMDKAKSGDYNNLLQTCMKYFDVE